VVGREFMLNSEPRQFDTMQEAFDWVRECDAPKMAVVDGQLYKLYPSGRAEERRVRVAQ
jgi:hypothetical protein